MRRVFSLDFPLGSAFHKALASVLSLALVLGPASAVAYDDDRYTYTPPRVQDYQNPYKPQNNYSPSFQLDRQISNMNSVLTFKQNVGYATPKIDLKIDQIPQDTFKPKILFQLAMANPVKAPVQDAKPLQPITVGKPGFLGAVQSIFKGIGAGFQKVGQAIGNVIQRVFTRTDKPGAISPQQKEILAQYPNLQPTGPNSFVAAGKATVAFGKVWEPGSTFTTKDGNLQLNQGVSLESSFGGIKDKNGGLLPVRMTTVDGNITAVGLDFDRMRANTTLLVSQPTRVDGFGTIHPGEMTYQGPVKSPTNETVGGHFSFTDTQVNFNPSVGKEMNMANPATLRQATFVLQAGVMRLNSVLIDKGARSVYTSENQKPVEVTVINSRLEATLPQVDALATKVDTMAREIDIYATAIRSVVGHKAAKGIGLTVDQADTVAQARLLNSETANLKSAVAQGNYAKADERLSAIDQSIAAVTAKLAPLERNWADTKLLAKELIDNQRALQDAKGQSRPKTSIGRVAMGTLSLVKGALEVVRGWVGLFEKLPIAGPVIKAAWQFKNEVMGLAFSVFSGDFLDKQPPMSFDSDPKNPAVIFINGILNRDDNEVRLVANSVFEAFGSNSGVRIQNGSHGPFGILDFVQIAGHEYFGAYDRPVRNMAKAILKGIEQKGEVYVVAHSQGTAIFAKALELLPADVRSKTHYYGAGSEWFVDPAKSGLASGENVWNKKDVVPTFGNYIRISNNIIPGEAGRKYRPITRVIGDDQSWRQIEASWPGEGSKNHHHFGTYYSQDMQAWARRMLANKLSEAR